MNEQMISVETVWVPGVNAYRIRYEIDGFSDFLRWNWSRGLESYQEYGSKEAARATAKELKATLLGKNAMIPLTNGITGHYKKVVINRTGRYELVSWFSVVMQREYIAIREYKNVSGLFESLKTFFGIGLTPELVEYAEYSDHSNLIEKYNKMTGSVLNSVVEVL